MTSHPRSIPAIALQSLPSCCVLCRGKRWVAFGVPGRSPVTPVRCPHCTNTADLLALIEGAAS